MWYNQKAEYVCNCCKTVVKADFILFGGTYASCGKRGVARLRVVLESVRTLENFARLQNRVPRVQVLLPLPNRESRKVLCIKALRDFSMFRVYEENLRLYPPKARFYPLNCCKTVIRKRTGKRDGRPFLNSQHKQTYYCQISKRMCWHEYAQTKR